MEDLFTDFLSKAEIYSESLPSIVYDFNIHLENIHLDKDSKSETSSLNSLLDISLVANFPIHILVFTDIGSKHHVYEPLAKRMISLCYNILTY